MLEAMQASSDCGAGFLARLSPHQRGPAGEIVAQLMKILPAEFTRRFSRLAAKTKDGTHRSVVGDDGDDDVGQSGHLREALAGGGSEFAGQFFAASARTS